jgi:hypothetical protein
MKKLLMKRMPNEMLKKMLKKQLNNFHILNRESYQEIGSFFVLNKL